MTALSPAMPRAVPQAVPRVGPPVGHHYDFDVAEFVRTEYPRVVSAVRMIAGDRDSAVDAVQEAIVQLLSDRDHAWPRNIAAWVTVVASNRARDVHRRNAIARRVVDRLRPSLPEDPAERAGRDLDVLAAVDTLPRRMRQVCVLHYLQDQSVREIALALGIGTGTVKTQLYRGRIALASRLGTERV